MTSPRLFAVDVDDSGESTRLVRVALFVSFVLFGGMFAWGLLAPMNGAVVADGVIKVDTNRKSVQHLEGGIVRRILVREGMQVEAGQALLELVDVDTSSNVNILTDTLNALLAKEARLFAEATLSERIRFPQEVKNDRSEKTVTLVQNEEALFQSKRKTLFDQIKLLKDEISHAGSGITHLQSQISATQDGSRYIEEQIKAAERLIEKRFLDNNSLLELKGRLSEKRESLGQQNATLAQQRQNVAELELRIINLRNEYSKMADDELKETRKLIFETQERIRPAQDQLQRTTITSPTSGQVINLKATTVGGVIKPGDSILDIVPNMLDLILEVKINPVDIDVVHVGQTASVQLAAFNQRTTPMIKGKLTYLSGDALTDETSQDRSRFFLGHIKTDQESLEPIRNLSLSPGMPVVAYLQTEPRTFFQYILSPVTSQLRRALLEQ